MTTTAIEGGWVITGDPNEPWIEGGHVTVVDGLIQSVGRENAPGGVDRTIDAGGILVSPGFVNGHTHLCMSLGRSLGADASLLEWLSGAQLPLMSTFEPEDYEHAVMLGALENLKAWESHSQRRARV